MGLISRVSSRTYRELVEKMKSAVLQTSARFMTPKQTMGLVQATVHDNRRFQPGKQIHSQNLEEARKNVRSLYRSYLRSVPLIMTTFKVAKLTEGQIYSILRDEFEKHSHVTDPRVIDLLVIKGKIELQEQVELWQQRTHFYRRFNETTKKAPDSFMGKFLTQKNF